MAKYELTSPTGERFEVTAPDSASQDDVLSYAQANYAPSSPEPIKLSGTESVSTMSALGQGALQGVSLGFADEVEAGIRALAKQGVPFDKAYDQTIQEVRGRYKEAASQHPGAFNVGEVAGSILPIAAATSVAPVAGMAATGALEAAGKSETSAIDHPFKLAGEAALGGATGAVIGKAGEVLPGVAKAIGNKIAPNLENAGMGELGHQAVMAARTAHRLAAAPIYVAGQMLPEGDTKETMKTISSITTPLAMFGHFGVAGDRIGIDSLLPKLQEKFTGSSWLPLLVSAAAKGGLELKALDYALQQQSPEYQKARDIVQKENYNALGR